MQLFNIILFWIFFGFLASHIAKRRGRRPQLWFIMGLVLGLIGIVLLLVLPRPKPKKLPPPLRLRRPQHSDAWLKMWYYLDPSHIQKGPIEFPDLIKLRKENHLSDKSLIWGEGMKEWKHLAEMPDLLKEIDQTPR